MMSRGRRWRWVEGMERGGCDRVVGIWVIGEDVVDGWVVDGWWRSHFGGRLWVVMGVEVDRLDKFDWNQPILCRFHINSSEHRRWMPKPSPDEVYPS